MTIFLLIPILWIAAASGAQATKLIFRKSESKPDSLECFVYSALIGFGALAYGNLALGLLGQFKIEAVAVWLVVLAVIGAKQHVRIAKALVSAVKSVKFSPFSISFIAILAVFFLASLFGVLIPPYPLEYDSLSYHLADPKIYILNHRIIALPWESHSNFAFTMEMLYSIGLMLHSFALAKSFHLTMAVFSAIGIYCVCRRFGAPKAGAYGALIFVSMPLVWWLAGTGYVDLAAAAYGIWSFHALVLAIEKRSRSWMFLLAVTLGLMISIKALSVVTAFLSLAVLLFYALRGELDERLKSIPFRDKLVPALKTILLVGALTALVGCPWYVKSWVNTGNPVYPFAYGVFGGRGWDLNNAAQYAKDQASFGVGHLSESSHPNKLGDFVLSPWNLTLFTMPGHVAPPNSKDNPFNDTPLVLMALGPLFLAVLFAFAFFKSPVPFAVRLSLGLSIVTLFFWVFATEQERYLTSIYPLLCVSAGYVLFRLLEEKRISGYAAVALLSLSVLQSLFFARVAIAQWMPVVSGAETEREFLLQNFDAYAAFQIVNQKPDNGGVVLYGEPRAFYCDKPYMWGEPTHGKVIPYDSLPDAQALRRYLLSKGYRYILVNRIGAPLQPAPQGQTPQKWSEKLFALLQTLPYEQCDSHGVLILYSL